jgi:hypothetical protein
VREFVSILGDGEAACAGELASGHVGSRGTSTYALQPSMRMQSAYARTSPGASQADPLAGAVAAARRCARSFRLDALSA